MSRYLEECKKLCETLEHPIIRISEIKGDGDVESFIFKETNYCENVYSCAKTFTAVAIGLLYDKGLLDVSEKVCDVLKEEIPKNGMDERWYSTTIDMALRHSIGLPGGFLDIDVHPISEFTNDFLTYMLTYPLEFTPGERYVYTDAAFYLLARIAEKRSGLPLDIFMWPEFFSKLGFQEVAWSRCPMGHAMGGTGLYINTADMVKLPAVYLHGGMWKGKRVLSEKWVSLSIEKGYGISVNSDLHFFHKGGMYGQDLVGFMDQDRAIAIQSFGGDCEAITRFTLDYED